MLRALGPAQILGCLMKMTWSVRFGKSGSYYYRICRGEDDRPVRTSRGRKSLGAERTFEQNLTDLDAMMERLTDIIERVSNRLQESQLAGHSVTLKIKTADFQVTTRQTTSDNPVFRKEGHSGDRQVVITPSTCASYQARSLAGCFPLEPAFRLGCSASRTTQTGPESVHVECSLQAARFSEESLRRRGGRGARSWTASGAGIVEYF